VQTRQYGNAYNLLILVLTVVSLVVMVLLWLPFNAETRVLLRGYDTAICIVFLLDFAVALHRAPDKRRYFLKEGGCLDLLGALPSFGREALGLIRLARLHRLRRISRSLGHQSRKQMVADLLRNRAQYALATTVLSVFLVVATTSLVVLDAESGSPTGNIRTAGDAFWWSMVTIATVGYGDFYPVTLVGRLSAMMAMVVGVGLIASLASIMSRALVNPSQESARAADLERRLEAITEELVALRRMLQHQVEPVAKKEGAGVNQASARQHPQ
jgi:voltage-gated potassium channel